MAARNPEYPITFRDLTVPEGSHIASTHPQHAELLACSYGGFVREGASAYAEATHERFRRVFAGLQQALFFQYDLTQPRGPGSRLVRTSLMRALVGDPGMTYLQEGVRMFGHPWQQQQQQERQEREGGAGCEAQAARTGESGDYAPLALSLIHI